MKKSGVKEVSDKVVVILVVIAVLVSIVGTILVFNVGTTGSVVSDEPLRNTETTKVELYVDNPDIPSPEGIGSW